MDSNFAQTSPHIHDPKMGGMDIAAATGAAFPFAAKMAAATHIVHNKKFESCNSGSGMNGFPVQEGEKKVQHTGIDELTDSFRELSLESATFHRLAAMVRSDDPTTQAEGMRNFRLVLSASGEIPIQEVVECGVVPIFVKILNQCNHQDASSPSLILDAAWSLTNIASGSPEQTEIVVKYGGISPFLRLLDSPREELREQGMWGLGNIAGGIGTFRDQILASDRAMLKVLTALEKSQKVVTIRTGVWAISNLCRGKPKASFASVKPAVSYLASIVLYSTDPNLLCDACWALDGVGESSDGVSAIVQSGILKRLMQLIDHPLPTVQRPALRVTGQIATGTATQTQSLITAGITPLLTKMLRAPTKSLRKDACWTISNIAAGTKGQLQALILHGAFPLLVHIFHRDEEIEVKKEASWAITNACTIQDETHLEHLIEVGCVAPVCEILQADESRILEVALRALHNILCFGSRKMSELGMATNPCAQIIMHAGGVVKLLSLQKVAETCGNFLVWQKSGTLLQTYFSGVLP